jgi:hypothetical protein
MYYHYTLLPISSLLLSQKKTMKSIRKFILDLGRYFLTGQQVTQLLECQMAKTEILLQIILVCK